MTITPVEIRMMNGDVFYDESRYEPKEAIENIASYVNYSPDSVFLGLNKGIYRVSEITAITFGKEREE